MKYTRYILLVLLSVMLLAGCNDWLDRLDKEKARKEKQDIQVDTVKRCDHAWEKAEQAREKYEQAQKKRKKIYEKEKKVIFKYREAKKKYEQSDEYRLYGRIKSDKTTIEWVRKRNYKDQWEKVKQTAEYKTYQQAKKEYEPAMERVEQSYKEYKAVHKEYERVMFEYDIKKIVWDCKMVLPE